MVSFTNVFNSSPPHVIVLCPLPPNSSDPLWVGESSNPVRRQHLTMTRNTGRISVSAGRTAGRMVAMTEMAPRLLSYGVQHARIYGPCCTGLGTTPECFPRFPPSGQYLRHKSLDELGFAGFIGRLNINQVRRRSRVFFDITSQRVFWINCGGYNLFGTRRGSEGRKLFVV